MEQFFTSDQHFYHKAVIVYSNRPFSSVEEMNETMIDSWNATVGPLDVVWHLGDFAFANQARSLEIFNRLNGIKHLIIGNHDRDVRKLLGWRSVSHIHMVKTKTARVALCHYPMEVWNESHHGSYHLHGHSHGTLTTKRPRRLDVGVDSTYKIKGPFGTPLALEEVVEILQNDTPQPVDHHGARSE